jgi:hypothetical protein
MAWHEIKPRHAQLRSESLYFIIRGSLSDKLSVDERNAIAEIPGK